MDFLDKLYSSNYFGIGLFAVIAFLVVTFMVVLFFGKKGFSVIVSPRTGTDEGLNQLMVDLVSNYINER